MVKSSFILTFMILVLAATPAFSKDKKNDTSDMDRTAGTTLLSSFSCDSIGKESQGVISSIQNFKTAVASMENTSQQCKAAYAQIAALPDINKIIGALQAQNAYQDLLKQEQILNNAQTNLLAVSQLPSGSPNLSLYPDQATIEQTISVASAQLAMDQANMAGEQGVAAQQPYLIGIQQLDQMGSSLVDYMKDDQGCFKNGSGAKAHLAAGLVGIAGFFLDSPWGMGAAAAGKILQTLFSLHEAAHFNPAKDAFSASDQAELVAGLSCAIETLGKEHCALYRQSQLVQGGKTEVCKDCDDAEKLIQHNLLELTDGQKQNLEAVNQVINWTANTQLSSALNLNDRQRMQKIASSYQTIRSGFDGDMTNARKQLEGLPKGTREKIQADSLSGILSSLTDLMGKERKDGQGNVISNSVPPELTAYLYTPQQKDTDFLNFIYDSPDDVQKVYAGLQAEYTKAFSKANGEESVPPTSAKDLYDRLIHRPVNSRGPVTQQVYDLLQAPDSLDNLETRMHVLDKRVASITKPQVTDQKLGQLINDFYGDPGSGASPLGALRKIQSGLTSLPADFQQKYGNLTGLPDLLTKINKITTDADNLLKNNFSNMDLAKLVIKESQDLVGQENELYIQVDTTLKRARSYYLDQLKTYTQNKGDATTFVQTVFKMNSDVLKNTAAFAFNPTLQQEDFGHALSMSGSQLDAYTKYFALSDEPKKGDKGERSYLMIALNYLNGKSPDGTKGLSQGMQQVLSDPTTSNLKNNFCMKLLGLTEIPSYVYDGNGGGECAGASLPLGGKQIRFADFAKEPINQRACVYQLYLEKENQESRAKVNSSSSH